jgi:hypothetical protein
VNFVKFLKGKLDCTRFYLARAKWNFHGYTS